MTRGDKITIFIVCVAFAFAPHWMVPFMQWAVQISRYEAMNVVSVVFAFVFWPVIMLLIFIAMAARWKGQASSKGNENEQPE